MKTFEELFCERMNCDVPRFRKRVFYASLPWRAKVCAPFLGGYRGRYFDPERRLVVGAGEATNLGQIRSESRDYYMNPAHRRWPRKVAGIRVSTRKLQRIALASGLIEQARDVREELGC